MKTKNLLKSLTFISLFIIINSTVFTSPIADSWYYSTILIQNEWNRTGTGFLISREIAPKILKIFLCTNKHVLNIEKEKRNNAQFIKCYFNIEQNSQIVTACYILELNIDGQKRWREHPDENIDVLVFDVTDLIKKVPNMVKKWGDYNLIADKEILEKENITVGDDIFILGYPNNKFQGENFFPIIRQGIIASKIGNNYIQNNIHYRGFLIDGGIATVHGQSGSPVVLKPMPSRFIKGNIVFGASKSYLLGILAQTDFTNIPEPKQEKFLEFSGMGIAFDAITIKETIELFFNN